jgi:hypothetical protein
MKKDVCARIAKLETFHRNPETFHRNAKMRQLARWRETQRRFTETQKCDSSPAGVKPRDVSPKRKNTTARPLA